MPSGERFIRGLMKFAGVRTFTTVDFTGISTPTNYVTLSHKGQGRLNGKVVEIPDNGLRGIRLSSIGKWVNIFDNSKASPPRANVKDSADQYLTPKITLGIPMRVTDLGGAVVVYHGPGNTRRFPTR